jgi:hypothetical protein
MGAAAVSPLCRALGSDRCHVTCKAAAARILGRLGGSEAVVGLCGGLGYFYAEVAEAVSKALLSIGSPAVPHLCDALGKGGWGARKAAAELLVALYQSGRLDEGSKHQVLAVRQVMMQSHTDSHNDCAIADRHTDEGIGVAF